MHQQSRHPARMTSPASSPQTNPTRTNNPREAVGAATRARSASEGLPGQALSSTAGDSGETSGSGPSREAIKKLDQIIQNFYYKAAVLILQSRIKVTPIGGRGSEKGKTNKWFQIETDDIDDFREELKIWRSSGSYENRPPPMIIETYLDASRLSNSQSLVIVDDNGKRCDVLEALNSSQSSSGSGSPSRLQRRNNEVILERWRVELKCIPTDEPDDFAPSLPTIYKRSIVFFRSLYTTTHIMPTYKYAQHKGSHPALEVKCRFLMGEPEHPGFDPLRQPLYDGSDVVTDYVFGDLEVPVGRFSASVTFRNDVNFRVDDSESLLSSHFMGVDENFFKPSLPQRREHARTESYGEVGSLPSNRQSRLGQEPQQTYGSLSTFHGAGALGTSPMTALRAVRPIGSDTSSPTGSAPGSVEPDPPHSLPIRPGQPSASRPLKAYEAISRRPSVSLAINPFKNGSLSGSPKLSEGEPPASPSQSRGHSYNLSLPRTNRSSLTAGMAASLRGGPPPPVEQPVVGSPRPQNTSRYSSSFTHRRGRPSFGGQSRPGDDDQISSGRQSLSSSAQPGSGLLAEVGGAASSGSFQTDDDNISDFLKALDSRKTLQSFELNNKGEASTAKRTAAQLSKFALMRESNNALTDSITSSMHLHRSSSSSSRQLANVPSMVNPASMSASSSPSKPLSPHTPHTPAIPSRLSEIEYPGQRQAARRRAPNPDTIAAEEEEGGEGDGADDAPVPVSQEGTTAIDIPLSPRLLQQHAHDRRGASSAAAHHYHHHRNHPQQHRSSTAGPPPRSSRGGGAGRGGGGDDDDVDDDVEIGLGLTQRSLSLGADDDDRRSAPPPALSTLRAALQQQRAAAAASATATTTATTTTTNTSASSAVGSPAVTGPGSISGGSGSQQQQQQQQQQLLLRPAADIRPASSPAPTDRDTTGAGGKPSSGGGSPGSLLAGSGTPYRLRYPVSSRGGGGSGRSSAPPPPHPQGGSSSSRGSFSGGPAAAAARFYRSGGGGGGEDGADDEPLVFAMSELERDSRRSLEEQQLLAGRGAAGSGSASTPTGEAGGPAGHGPGFEPRGTSKRGW